MTPRKVSTPGTDAAAVQPTTSVVSTNPEGIASSDTEPDNGLTATQYRSASVGEGPSLSVGTLQPLVAGLANLGASSGTLLAIPTHRPANAPQRPTPTPQPPQPPNLEELSAAYAVAKDKKRLQHMGDHLIAAERVCLLQGELAKMAAAQSAMADTFATAVAAKDARILELETQLDVALAAIQNAERNGCTKEASSDLLEAHFQLGVQLEKCHADLRNLTTEHGQAITALQASLDAIDRSASRAEAEVARLLEVNTELVRQNTEFGKRPTARANGLTADDVLAMIAARTPRAEAATPMETDNGAARGCTSADLYHGCGNGRAMGQKHTLPQGVRQDDPTPTEPMSHRQLALMKARKAAAAPSYAKAAKKERLLHYHSDDHPIAPTLR